MPTATPTAPGACPARSARASATTHASTTLECAPVPPVVVLYHELAHVYDYFNGTLAGGVYTGADNPGVPNRERAAVGLPFDHDADPDTAERMDPRHPFEFTENGLRDEFDRPVRTFYYARRPPRPALLGRSRSCSRGCRSNHENNS